MSTRNDEPQRASRPWDKGRDGFVLGEGAGVLVLERASAAAARGRTPYAVLAGAGITSDAYDIVQPDQAGQIRAMRLAIERSGIDPDDIVHVNAHAHVDAGRRHGRGERGSPTCSARTPSSPAPSR